MPTATPRRAGQKIQLIRDGEDVDGDKPQEVVPDAVGRFVLGEPSRRLPCHAPPRLAREGEQPGRRLTYAPTFEAVQ